MASIPTSGQVSSLQWAQLVIFAIEAPIMTYNLIVHGKNGALGWFFLQQFCLLRAIGYIIVKAATSADMLEAGSIIAQVALSSLFFGFFGIWHECTSTTRYKHPFLFGWKAQVVLHLAVAVSIGLLVPGAIEAIDDKPTFSNPKPGDNLVLAGISLFVVCWFALLYIVVVLNKTPGKLDLEKKLLLAITICTPLLGIRVLYSLLGAAIDSQSWSFVTGGTIAEAVVLAALPEFIIITTLAIAGVIVKIELSNNAVENTQAPFEKIDQKKRMASFTDHSITPALDNDSFSGNLQPVEKPNAPTTYSPSDGWNCLCKGAQLEFMIRRGIYEANVPSAPKQPPGPLNTPSTFQDPKTDLAGWGAWSMTGSVIGSLATLLRNIGVSDVSKCSYWNANRNYPVGDQSHQSVYSTVMCPSDGLIMSTISQSPKNDPWPANMPKQWSDVVFLGWKDMCSQQTPPVDPGNLKYIVRRHISNKITVGVINNYAPDVSGWPGTTFGIGDRAGQALLGTPNGYGPGFLLLQHQTTFGNRKIQTVQVWNEGSLSRALTMVFGVGEEQNPLEPMAAAWEWVDADGDELMLDARSEEGRGRGGLQKAGDRPMGTDGGKDDMNKTRK
ncbi:hypothetical protein MMC10_004862 [Thelotrema lepadinum]|nr:hypothetical protein [Thelotrema lepadinum]